LSSKFYSNKKKGNKFGHFYAYYGVYWPDNLLSFFYSYQLIAMKYIKTKKYIIKINLNKHEQNLLLKSQQILNINRVF